MFYRRRFLGEPGSYSGDAIYRPSRAMHHTDKELHIWGGEYSSVSFHISISYFFENQILLLSSESLREDVVLLSDCLTMNGDVEHRDEPPSVPRKIFLERGTEGYGFNLHGEKGVHGQFISAVDPDSPAHIADVRVGDRVIGVNDEDVEDLPHSKVVERIRSGGNKVILLVIDRECDEFYKSIAVKIPQDKFEVSRGGPSVAAVPEPQVNNTNNAEEIEVGNANGEVLESHVDDAATEEKQSEGVSAEDTVQDTEDGNEYEEVIPKSTNEAITNEAAPIVPHVEPPPPSNFQQETFVAPDSTTPDDDLAASTVEPVKDESSQSDMAAARPKPKRHEVKRATQNWKQKYEDFNKL